MKKLPLLLSTIGAAALIGCGGGGSEEAKQLLQKLLNVVGIPYNIIATVCQDDNSNGFCESTELQAKLFIEQGDSAETIWQKLTQLEEGQYFLETYDVTKPLLLVLRDTENVQYDGGEFALNFDGFITEEINETKELSILQSMIDADHLTEQNVQNIRNLDSDYTQERFYATLLSDLESNINTLRSKGLTSLQTVAADIKEMADELLINGIETTIPNQLNTCNEDPTCVTNVLTPLSNELRITEEEANEIVEKVQTQEEAEPATTATTNKIDFAEYLVGSDMTKEYIEYDKYLEQENTYSYKDIITVNGNTITYNEYYTYDNNTEPTSITTILTINDSFINSHHTGTESSESDDINIVRYTNIGETLWTHDQTDSSEYYTYSYQYTCTSNELLTNFTHNDHSYSGEILKVQCISTSEYTNLSTNETSTSYDIWFQYFQKSLGHIASIDDDCMNEQYEVHDTEGCTANSHFYEYYLGN